MSKRKTLARRAKRKIERVIIKLTPEQREQLERELSNPTPESLMNGDKR